MAIRWRREEKMTGLMRVTQGPRGWYLQDSETDQEYMRVVWKNEQANPMRRAGWTFKIVNPATEANLTAMGRWDEHLEAKAAADVWWKRNREVQLAKFNDNVRWQK